MGQRQRYDRPGQIHHVMNRGVAKRVIFEDYVDYRRFSMLLACATRRGQLQVIAYALMPNHFHLLVRSNGSLSEAMRRIQNDYVRWFNRRHRRDGPLVRGRFKSCPVNSSRYFGVLLWYLDHNAVLARICDEPSAYPWSSARFYSHGSTPPWLASELVEEHLADFQGANETAQACYLRLFSSAPPAVVAEVAEATLASRRRTERHLDSLLRARPKRVLSWIRAKLRNADGHDRWAVVAAPSAVRSAIEVIADRTDLTVRPTQKSCSPWPILEAGWRFLLAGQPQPAIAQAMGVSQSTISKRARWHKMLVEQDDDYARVATEACRLAIRITFPNRGRS